MTVLSPKIPTSYTGIFYKEVVNDDKKVVDKIFLIRYKDEIGRDKQKTIGKYSQGIRLTYCKAIRDETIRFNNERERYLTTIEIELLKKAVSHEMELLLFVEIALSTGARLGSIMEMKKSDIDFENESIKINNFKTNDKYIGYLNDSTLKLLVPHTKRMKKDAKIFSVSRSYVSYKIRGIMKKLFNEGITDEYQKVVIHTL